MKRQWFIFAAIALLALVLSACGGEPAAAPVAYDDENLIEYAGVWFSGNEDARAYLLQEHGMYSLFDIAMGEAPVKTESGLYRKIVGEDYLSFDSIAKQTFTEQYRLELQMDENSIYDDDIGFERVTKEQDIDYISTLMDMETHMEAYIGEWSNDSNFTQLIVSDEHYILSQIDATRSGTFEKFSDHLVLATTLGDLRLETTSDGGLSLYGIDGLFYEKGSDEVLEGSHMVFIGTWVNETTGDVFNLVEDGTYFWSLPDDTITYGRFDVEGDVITIQSGEDVYFGPMYMDDVISLSGFIGEFVRND